MSIIRMKIQQADIDWAKKQTKAFDGLKSHEKFSFSDNYIGLLGELYFHKWLDSLGVVHEWVDFKKSDYTKTDFIINGHSVDVKTSFDTRMWLQDTKWYFYVFCRVNEDLDEFFIIRYSKGKSLQELIDTGVVKQVDKGRVANPYVVSIEQMTIMDYFLEEIK